MSVKRDLQALRREIEDAGRILEEHGGGDTADLRDYRDDPIGFIRDILKETDPGPWERQIEIAEAVRDRPRVVVRSGHGQGKDWLGARLLLWWVYARDGMAIVTAASARQVKNIVMREVRTAFRKAGNALPGTLLTSELRLDDEPRLLAFTSNAVDTATGFHDAAVLVVISEGQGARVEDTGYDAAFAVATSSGSRILALGNPVRKTGRFADICRANNWHTITIPATEHPNVVHGETIIPNGPDQFWIDAVAEEYGRDSDWFRSRVLAQFPREDIRELVKREWIERAVELWHKREADGWRGPVTFGVDVARSGGDRSALAIYQGGIREVKRWAGAATTTSADKVEAVADWMGIRPEVVCDVIGLGAGVVDTLRERGWTVHEFNASAGASDPARFANSRADAAWVLRKELEAGRCALPPDEALHEEILAHEWGVDPQGRIQLVAKDEVRAAIKRSPDKFDAVSMAIHAAARHNVPDNFELGPDAVRPSPWRAAEGTATGTRRKFGASFTL